MNSYDTERLRINEILFEIHFIAECHDGNRGRGMKDWAEKLVLAEEPPKMGPVVNV